jgi:hypothetical protein
MTARLSIRPKVYRGRDGFSISGTDAHGRRTRIFTETRSSAEHIRAKVRAGLDIDLEDFTK